MWIATRVEQLWGDMQWWKAQHKYILVTYKSSPFNQKWVFDLFNVWGIWDARYFYIWVFQSIAAMFFRNVTKLLSHLWIWVISLSIQECRINLIVLVHKKECYQIVELQTPSELKLKKEIFIKTVILSHAMYICT